MMPLASTMSQHPLPRGWESALYRPREGRSALLTVPPSVTWGKHPPCASCSLASCPWSDACGGRALVPKGGVGGGERAASLGSNARRLPRHEERVEYIGVSLLFSEKERLHLHRMEGATMGGASTRSQITLT